MSIPQMVAELKPDRKFVAPISDYQLGRQMFKRHIAYEQCTSADMRNGWLAAENQAAWMYYRAMDAEGMADKAVW